MKKILLIVLTPFVFWCGCTEKTYNYYLEVEKGALAGVVEPAESGARVSAWQGREVSFTFIDSTGYFILSDLPVGTYTIKVEADGYTTYESKPNYTIYGGGTTTVGTITLSPFPDLISSVYPPDKATDVSVGTSIRIIFKQSMNKKSVENAFSINPNVEGNLYWRDYYGNYIEFDPTYSLSPGITYTVTLDTAIQDMDGNHLSEPFSFSFTITEVGVESSYPENGQSDVSTATQISVYFNTIMDRQSVEDAFSIIPITPGKFEWSKTRSTYGNGADRLSFKPDNYLKINTIYTIKLDTIAQDVNGICIPETFSFFFTTENLRITRTYPLDGYTGISTSAGIGIYFSTGMDKVTTEDAFSILPAVEGDFDWNLSSTYFNFRPELGYLAANTTYEVRVETTASDLYGERLSQGYQFSFNTDEIELSCDPSDKSIGVRTSVSIGVLFSTGMDPGSIINSFNIAPEVEGNFQWSQLNLVRFYPDQVLASNTSYTVTVDTSARDLYGIKLNQDYSFSFATQEIRIILHSPERGATYVYPDADIIIYFNTDMDQASVVNAFSMIDSDSTEVNGEFSWYDLYILTFDPDLALTLNEEYTVIIGTGASDIRGVHMPQEFVLWFETHP